MAALPIKDRYKASPEIAQKYPQAVDANGYFVGHPETDLGRIVGLARQNSTAYSVGDVALSASLPSGLVLKCTTGGTTAATKPSFSGAAVGDTVTDGTVTWLISYYNTDYESIVDAQIDPVAAHNSLIRGKEISLT